MTQSGTVEDREVLLQVVRGQRPWTDLRKIGIDISVKGNRCTFHSPRPIAATADVHDLAKGFIAHRNNALALREWAFVVEAADMDLDVENHPAGETVLHALWDASFGNPISDEAQRTIEQLASENGSRA